MCSLCRLACIDTAPLDSAMHATSWLLGRRCSALTTSRIMRLRTEPLNTSLTHIYLPVGCDRIEMRFATESSPDMSHDACVASARLAGSTGREVYIVGVSHTSPFYGTVAAQAISATSPRHVVLEVCEVRVLASIALLWQPHQNRIAGLRVRHFHLLFV